MDAYNTAATLIQSYYRGFTARKDYQTKKTAATKIQKNYRGFQARKQISTDMETGALTHKKKKKKGVKYVWNKMKHCWTKVTGHFHDHSDQKKEEENVANELWELSQKKDLPDGQEVIVGTDSEEEVDGYKIPVVKPGKSLTLLQLKGAYSKKHENDPDDDPAKVDPLVKYGAPVKSPYQSAYGEDVSPYSEYSEEFEPNVPRKQHKIIKYVAPEPEIKPEEESGFFSMFKRKDPPKDVKEGEQKDENILGQMGGKFMGLFQAKPADTTEAGKADANKTDADNTDAAGQESEPKTEAPPPTQGQKQLGFLGLFSSKPTTAEPPKQEEGKPAEENKPAEEGLFGKFQGLFKPKSEESKPIMDTAEVPSAEIDLLQTEQQPITAETEEKLKCALQNGTDAHEAEDDDDEKYSDDDDYSDKGRPDDYDDDVRPQYSDRDRDEYSDREGSDREYSDEVDEYSEEEDDDDDQDQTEESATSAEFKKKFMDFLNRDVTQDQTAEPAEPVQPAEPLKPAEEGGFFTKMFKKDEPTKPESPPQEQSGMGKMFGFFKAKT